MRLPIQSTQVHIYLSNHFDSKRKVNVLQGGDFVLIALFVCTLALDRKIFIFFSPLTQNRIQTFNLIRCVAHDISVDRFYKIMNEYNERMDE